MVVGDVCATVMEQHGSSVGARGSASAGDFKPPHSSLELP